MNEERRRYFRIEDEVLLAMRPIEKSEVDDCLEDFWSNEQALSQRFNYNFLIEQHISDRLKIANRMPELGRYLDVLEKQIDRITEKLLVDDDDQAMSRMSVNLSAQGVAFDTDQALQQGDLAELKLKLLPSGLRLVIIARVVMIESDIEHDHGRHKVSMDFENLHEADREILIKHMHANQMESLSKAQET